VCSLCRTEKCDCSTDSNDKTRPLRKDVIKNEEDFDRVLKNLDVLARSRPEDKYALVTGLINKGIVVAVTGDGTNDAPALKKADVGFAMGRSGTEIAREASSIVLLDDNFNSIVKAVLWGRNIYDSIKKFIQFQITVNIVAVATTLIGAIVLRQDILTPIQMLWLNMIMDTLASLALATEIPHESLLDRKPHNREEYIITKRMWKHIVTQSLYQLLVVMLIVFLGEWFIPESPDQFDDLLGSDNLQLKYNAGVVDGGHVVNGRLYSILSSTPQYKTTLDQYGVPSRHFTVVFNSFVMMQVFNFFNCRKLYDELNVLEGLTKNWLFLLVVLLIVCLQIVIVTFGSVAFSLYSYYGLTLTQWFICVIFRPM
jgi:Ca2+ transporting ATPase